MGQITYAICFLVVYREYPTRDLSFLKFVYTLA